MTDRYRDFEELRANALPDIDFRIRCTDRQSIVVLIAPHGGTVEPGTAQIAEKIAGTDLSFYAFEALKPGEHGDFHIMSHRFDEPRAVALVGRSLSAVAIHGRKDDGTDTVWLGGRATALRDAIGASLRNAGFGAENNKRLPGVHETNICNRTLSGEGVQLELPRSLRRQLMAQGDVLKPFCDAIRNAIRSWSLN